MPIIRILFVTICFLCSLAYAGDGETECGKYGNESEYGWNPSSEYTTERLNRFYELEDLINGAFQNNNYEKASSLSKENLELAEVYRCNWNYGNAIHQSNTVLGLIALEHGNVQKASEFLIAAGQSPGSPQLDSFGPDFVLAEKLLQHDEKEVVITYLKGVREFWDGNESTIDDWIARIQSGEDEALNQPSAGPYTMMAYAVSIAWPFVITLLFWLRLRRQLSSQWPFPVIAVPSGFVGMIIGGAVIGPVIIPIMDIVSADIVGPVIIGLSFITQFGLSFLAIFLVSKFFKRASVSVGH